VRTRKEYEVSCEIGCQKIRPDLLTPGFINVIINACEESVVICMFGKRGKTGRKARLTAFVIAVSMLAQKKVDLVGSAQYFKERAEVYQYAD